MYRNQYEEVRTMDSEIERRLFEDIFRDYAEEDKEVIREQVMEIERIIKAL
jgi:hypothetical protein